MSDSRWQETQSKVLQQQVNRDHRRPREAREGVVGEVCARSKYMKTHNIYHHVQGVANDVEWDETDKLNRSGWGEGGGGNVHVHYEESHKTSRHFFQLVN